MGQMSLWGELLPEIYIIIYLLILMEWYIMFFYSQVLILDLIWLISPINLNDKPKISKLKGIYRIGPHNIDIISIIFGSLLGDGDGEKRGLGTRINFYQEATHVTYLLYLHDLLSKSGYCNDKIPKISTRLGTKGKVRKIIRFSTWTYTSFNWIYDLWYKNKIKQVPKCIDKYLTPLALAIWIMDDGFKVNNGLKLSTNSFSYDDCLILVNALNNNYNLKCTIQSAGTPNQYIIYIWKESMENLRKIVSGYIIPSMKYKLNYN